MKTLSITVCLIAVGVLACGDPPANKTDALVQISPDKLTLGQVTVGARVDASVSVMLKRDLQKEITDHIEAPSFVTVTDVLRDTMNFFEKGTYFRRGITVTVDTRKAGTYLGPLKVTLGTRTVEIPVMVEILPRDTARMRMLVAQTPFSMGTTPDAGSFGGWLRIVHEANFDVNYIARKKGADVFKDIALGGFKVVLLGEEALVGLQAADLTKIDAYLADGGRVVLMANKFYDSTVVQANRIATKYGLEFENEEPADRKVMVVSSDSIVHEAVTSFIRKVNFHRPSPISVLRKDQARVIVRATGYPGKGFVAVARAGKGDVVAIGQSLWWLWLGALDDRESDNEVLFLRLIRERLH